MQLYQQHTVFKAISFRFLDDKNEMGESNRRRNDGNDDLTRKDSAMVMDEQTSSANDNISMNIENIHRDNLNHRNIDNFGLLGSVNTNLIPFIQKLREPTSKLSFYYKINV